MPAPVKVNFPDVTLPYWSNGIQGVSVYSPHIPISQMQADARRRGRRLRLELIIDQDKGTFAFDLGTDVDEGDRLHDLLLDDLERNPQGHPCRGCDEVYDDHPVMGCPGWH